MANLASIIGSLPTGLVQGAFIPPPAPQGSHTPPQDQSGLTQQNINMLRQQGVTQQGPGTGTDVPMAAGQQEAGIYNGIDFGVIPDQRANAQTIDDIIKQSGPAAEDILRAGTESAIGFSKLAQGGVEDSLSRFLNPQALGEQSAL